MAGGAAAAGGGGGAGEAAAAAEGVLGRARASGGCPRATLGLPGAGGAGAAAVTPAAARAAFRRLALALHPDKAKGAPGAEEAFKVANAALGRLLRQIQREEWDAAREARAAARAEAYAGSTAASAAPGVSEAAVRAAKEAWGGGGGGGGGGGAPPPANRRPPASAPRRKAAERGGGGPETGYSRQRSRVGGRGQGEENDEGCIFSFSAGESDDFQDKPARRASRGGVEQGGGSGEARSGGGDVGAWRAQRLPLGHRRNGAAEEAEVLAARVVWGNKKPRLDVYGAARGSASVRSASESPTFPQRKHRASGEMAGTVTAPSISPQSENTDKPGEAAARVTAAAILKRASKQVLLAKGRRGKKSRKGKGEQQTAGGSDGGCEQVKKLKRLVRAGDGGAGKATLPRSTARPTLLQQLGVEITTTQGPGGKN